jgi:hypothetical protein
LSTWTHKRRERRTGGSEPTARGNAGE